MISTHLQSGSSFPKKNDWLLKAALFSFVIVAFAFNETGLMGVFTILLAGLFFLKGMDSAKRSIGNYPIEFKFLNFWVIFTFISGVFVAKDMEIFLSAFRSLILLTLTINLIFLILAYDFRLIKYIFLAIFISGLIQFIGPLLGFQAAELADKDREYGLSSNPNSFGLKMVYASIPLLIYIISKNRKPIILWLLCLPLFYIFLQGIFDSGSRKSLMAFFVLIVGALTIIRSNKNKQINILRVGLVLGFFGGLAYLFLPYILEGTIVQERIEMGQDRGGVEGDIRYQMYLFAMNLFYENPLFGIGLNNFRAYFPTGQYSHSDYAESLSSTGFFGFGLYQLFYVIPLVKAYKLSQMISQKQIRLYLLFGVLLIVVVKIIGLGIILYNSPATMIIMTAVIAFVYKIDQNKNQLVQKSIV